ncbi:MAG: rRNA pseudouridine synthase [Fusobacteriaceae bacterium]|nr:rRNA pseudouridine synthase [Fusobacteriaceae bacterium]
MRLNKYLAAMGIGSRREIDKMVDEKKIMVNGIIANHGLKIDNNDEIKINGKKIKNLQEKKVYYILNKPINVLSSVKDDRGRKTVVDLIECNEKIFPIGRLDYDTTGLLLLTNDGELFNKVVHPRAEIYKEYILVMAGGLEKNGLFLLENGIKLEDGLTLPAKIKILDYKDNKSTISISIREGRNRQIRRMCRAINCKVLSLKRIKIGELSIENLNEGEYRELTDDEIKYLYSM